MPAPSLLMIKRTLGAFGSAAALVAAVTATTTARVDDQGKTATNLKSFEGIEEPEVRYLPKTDSFAPDSFVNITDRGDNTVRMTLRYRANDWWDADRQTTNKDRQRAEVKGLGVHQKDNETFEYGTTWRTDPNFKAGNRFCHVFQLKATDGDNSPPLIVLSILPGPGTAAVRYWSGDSKNFVIARKFPWKPNTWQTVKIRVHTSKDGKGEVTASVNGDAFQGDKSINAFRPRATDYRPKWGLYRGVTKEMPFGDDYVEHKNANARKM
jgi:hypothetical protein